MKRDCVAAGIGTIIVARLVNIRDIHCAVRLAIADPGCQDINTFRWGWREFWFMASSRPLRIFSICAVGRSSP